MHCVARVCQRQRRLVEISSGKTNSGENIPPSTAVGVDKYNGTTSFRRNVVQYIRLQHNFHVLVWR